MRFRLGIFLVFQLSWWCLDGSRILAFLPFPAKSHQRFFQPLLRGLAERGHNVTAYTTLRIENPPPNYKEILIEDRMKQILDVIDLREHGNRNPLEMTDVLYKMGFNHFVWVCSLPETQNLLQSQEDFDVVLLESAFTQEAYSYLGHKFRAPQVELSCSGDSTWLNYVANIPQNPSYMMDFRVAMTDRMSLWERLHNTLVSFGILCVSYYHLSSRQRLADERFTYPGWEERPPLQQALFDKSLFLINSHYSVSFAKPSLPNFVDVAGLHIVPNKPLPKDLQEFMDQSTEGVIYFSLGSNLRSSNIFDRKLRKTIVDVFKNLKQNILWKFEADLPEKPANVKISEWFPQQDILAHKNCKLFITHAGFCSLTEAVEHGVPMIGIPIFADQGKNMKHVTANKYGIQLDFGNITEDSLSWAINEIIGNKMYGEAAAFRSALFRDRPFSALHTAIYWIEHVIEHKGNPYLRSALSQLPWYKSLLLDVGMVMASLLLLLVLMSYLLIRTIFRLISGWRGRDRKLKQKSK